MKIVISLMLNENKRWLTRALMGKEFKELLAQNIKDFLGAAGQISSSASENLKKAIGEKQRLSRQEIKLAEGIFLNVDQFFDWGGNLDSYSRNFKRIPATTGTCKIMADGPLVLSDGRLSLCCVDYDGNAVVGDLKKESFQDIINSGKYKEISENFKNKKVALPYCQKCLGRWEHRNKLMNFLYRVENKIYHFRHYKKSKK